MCVCVCTSLPSPLPNLKTCRHKKKMTVSWAKAAKTDVSGRGKGEDLICLVSTSPSNIPPLQARLRRTYSAYPIQSGTHRLCSSQYQSPGSCHVSNSFISSSHGCVMFLPLSSTILSPPPLLPLISYFVCFLASVTTSDLVSPFFMIPSLFVSLIIVWIVAHFWIHLHLNSLAQRCHKCLHQQNYSSLIA